MEFVSVTVTDTMLVDWVLSVNGMVMVNCVPKGFDCAVFDHQVVNGAVSGTVTSD